jgi:putative heme-binding domain-containing protein
MRRLLALPLIISGFAAYAQEREPEIPKENPYQTEADVARGKKLFLGHCAPCHGPVGNGGKGANLAQPVLPRAADDASLFRVLRKGIPGTEMPGAWEMIDHEIWQVAAYVRTLGRTAVETPAAGDRVRGEQLFRGKGNCMNCHTVARQGGSLGPVLSDIGYRRSAGFLRQTLLDPPSTVPEGYLFVEIVTRDKRQVSGLRLDEDTFSIQVRDLSGGLHSLWKNDLAQLSRDPRRTPMPGYRGTFSDTEIDDVVAYLLSLRGAQ